MSLIAFRRPTSPLDRYFNERRIASRQIAPGLSVPAYFTSAAEEHMSVRRGTGLFDFSFMACFEITGPDAGAFLARVQPRPLARLTPGRIMYTFLLRPEDGCVLNDATIWAHKAGSYWLFTGRRSDLNALVDKRAGLDVSIRDRSGYFSILAVQGAGSTSALVNTLMQGRLSALRYFQFETLHTRFGNAWVGRIGYTGELGYEVIVPGGAGVDLWEAIRAADPPGVCECGFDAADSLRIEAGYVFFARELRYRVTAEELGYARLQPNARAGHAPRPPRTLRLVGLRPKRRPLEGLQPVPSGEGPARKSPAPGHAYLTSRVTSPLLERELAMGFVRWGEHYPGTSVVLDDGTPAQVARLPFFDPPRRKVRI